MMQTLFQTILFNDIFILIFKVLTNLINAQIDCGNAEQLKK
jgi:hypothetical protein